MELKKVKDNIFKDYYEGTTCTKDGKEKKVYCILDDNCVRYIVLVDGKRKVRREYNNSRKELCFKNATKALNN